MKPDVGAGASEKGSVSLCVREWIETKFPYVVGQPAAVSLCVREWIETLLTDTHTVKQVCLPLREGVD